MHSVKIRKTAGRIETFKPVAGSNRYAVTLSLNVTDKAHDDAVGKLFPGYAGKVSAMVQAESPSCEERVRKVLGAVNVKADSGGEPADKVLDIVAGEGKAPKLVIGHSGKSADLVVVVVGTFTEKDVGTLHVYRKADIMIEIESAQVDLDDESKRKSRKRRKKSDGVASASQVEVFNEPHVDAGTETH